MKRDPRTNPIPGDTFEFQSDGRRFRLEVMSAKTTRLAGQKLPTVQATIRLTWSDGTGQPIGTPRLYDPSAAQWRKMVYQARIVAEGMPIEPLPDPLTVPDSVFS